MVTAVKYSIAAFCFCVLALTWDEDVNVFVTGLFKGVDNTCITMAFLFWWLLPVVADAPDFKSTEAYRHQFPVVISTISRLL